MLSQQTTVLAYAVDMPVEIGLSLELLGARRIAGHRSARVRVFALWIVRLQMRLPVVAPFE